MNDNKLEAELLGALSDRHVLTTRRVWDWGFRATEHSCSKCGMVTDMDLRYVKKDKCPGPKDQRIYDENDDQEEF